MNTREILVLPPSIGSLLSVAPDGSFRGQQNELPAGGDKTKVNGDLCPPLSLPPGNDYSQSYRQEGPLAGEVLNIALTAKTLSIDV